MVCEICYKNATCMIQDLKEAIPPEGSKWAYFEIDGSQHYYCQEHARRPKKTYLPDTKVDVGSAAFWECLEFSRQV